MAKDLALQGVGNLILKLRDMGELDDGRVLRAAVHDAMEPVLVQARARAPDSRKTRNKPHKVYTGEYVSPGYARDHIKLVAGVTKDKQKGIASVGADLKGYYIGQYLERGHFTRRYTHTGRRNRKNWGKDRKVDWTPAQPWLRPAFYQNLGRIKSILGDSFAQFLIGRAKLP